MLPVYAMDQVPVEVPDAQRAHVPVAIPEGLRSNVVAHTKLKHTYWVSREILTVVTQLISIGGFIYSVLWFRNYRKQLLLANQIMEVRRALDELLNIGETLNILVGEPDKDTFETLNYICFSLRKLQYSLFLLAAYPGVSDALTWIPQLIDIIATSPTANVIDEIKSFLSWDDDHNKLVQLRERLLAIYTLKEVLM